MKALFLLALALPLGAGPVTTSYTGSLDPNNPDDVFTATFTLASTGAVNIQTWSYGGGTNGNGVAIPAGGFDPVIGLYLGTGDSATFVTYNDDGTCPPGNTKDFGGQPFCFDSTLVLSNLAAGTYTVSLTAFGNEPFASQQPSFNLFSDGFLGLAQYNDPADPTGNTSVTNNFAFDITIDQSAGPGPDTSTPEPSSAGLAAIGLAALGCAYACRTYFDSVLRASSARA